MDLRLEGREVVGMPFKAKVKFWVGKGLWDLLRLDGNSRTQATWKVIGYRVFRARGVFLNSERWDWPK